MSLKIYILHTLRKPLEDVLLQNEEYTKKGENMVPRKWETRHQEHANFWDGGRAPGIEAPQSGGDVRKPQRGLIS